MTTIEKESIRINQQFKEADKIRDSLTVFEELSKITKMLVNLKRVEGKYSQIHTNIV